MDFFPDIFEKPIKSFSNFFPGLFSSSVLDPAQFFQSIQSTPMKGVKIYEHEDKLHVEVPIPGLQVQDIDVRLKRGVLSIKGEAKEEEKDKKKKTHYTSKREYTYNFVLPSLIEENLEPEASYTDGILHISMKLSKHSEEESKPITVKTNNKKAQKG